MLLFRRIIKAIKDRPVIETWKGKQVISAKAWQHFTIRKDGILNLDFALNYFVQPGPAGVQSGYYFNAFHRLHKGKHCDKDGGLFRCSMAPASVQKWLKDEEELFEEYYKQGKIERPNYTEADEMRASALLSDDEIEVCNGKWVNYDTPEYYKKLDQTRKKREEETKKLHEHARTKIAKFHEGKAKIGYAKNR